MSEFELVVRKRNRRLRNYKTKSGPIENTEVISPVFSSEYIKRKINQAQDFVSSTPWYSTVVESIKNCLLELGSSVLQEILCYGLGNFSDSLIARYQLGLLLEIKKFFHTKVQIYDPVFTEQEKCILRSLKCTLINHNEEGKHKVSKLCLIYLPHCPKQLTNNFLCSNWGLRLSNCIIIGNSISNIINSNPNSVIKNKFTYISRISLTVKELEVANTFKYKDIFNDISIHIFPLERLLAIDYKFWET